MKDLKHFIRKCHFICIVYSEELIEAWGKMRVVTSLFLIMKSEFKMQRELIFLVIIDKSEKYIKLQINSYTKLH